MAKVVNKAEHKYVPTASEQKDITEALQFKEESYNDTRQERVEWRNAYWRYKLQRQLSDYEYVPDVQLGLTYDSVEKVTATLPGREFGFKAKPVGPEDTKNALLVSQVLQTAWNSPDIMDGPSKMDVIKKNMALFGSAFVQVYWDTVLDDQGNVIKSDPCLTPINIFDAYYNKFIPDIEGLPKFGSQITCSLQWLKDNGQQMGFQNTKFVQGFSPRSTGLDIDSSSIDKEETLSGKTSKPTIAKLFEVQTDKEILTLALDDSGPVWLRKVPNKLGRKNIVIFRLKRHPLPNRLLGVSDIMRGGAIEDAIQRVMNQGVFNSLLVDNPNFTFDSTDRHIDPRTFVTAPGAGIPRGKDPNSITPITFQSHLSESLELASNLLSHYKQVVEIPDILGGAPGGVPRAAAALNILDRNAKAGTVKIVDGMKGSMQKMAALIKKLYEVYGTESLTVQVRTPELADELASGTPENSVTEISKSYFSMDRDIDISVEFTSQDKSVLSQRIVEWLSLTAQDQSVPPQLRMAGYQQWLEFNDLDDLAMQYEEIAKTGQTSDLALADQENAKMASGQELPPTPNATSAHTQRHVDFMRRVDTGADIDRLLQAHIEGELQQAQVQPAQPGQTPQNPAAPVTPAPVAQTGTNNPVQQITNSLT